jgi:hypothetical protein
MTIATQLLQTIPRLVYGRLSRLIIVTELMIQSIGTIDRLTIVTRQPLAGLLVMKMSGLKMIVRGPDHRYTLNLALSLVSIANKVRLDILNKSLSIVQEPPRRQLKRSRMSAFLDRSTIVSTLMSLVHANLFMKDKWNMFRSPILRETM